MSTIRALGCILLLAGLSASQSPMNEPHDLVRRISSFLSSPSDLGGDVVSTSCDFFVTTSVSVESDLLAWLTAHSRGAAVVDLNDARTTNASRYGRLWRGSHCAFLVHRGDSGDELWRAKTILHRFKVARKALIFVSGVDSQILLNDSLAFDAATAAPIWSFDTILLPQNSNSSTQVICQKLGSVTRLDATTLADCYDVVPMLKGNMMQVSFVFNKPFIVTASAPVRGADVRIVNALRKKFGFDYSLKREQNFGREQLPNGTWVGIFESDQSDQSVFQMNSRSSELGLGELLPTLERFQYADFSYRTYFSEIVYATPLPKKVNSYNNIFRPINMSGWIGTVTSMLAVVLCLILTDWTYSRLNHGVKPHQTYKFVDLMLALAQLINLNTPNSWLNYRSLAARRLMLAFYIPLAGFVSMGYKSVLLITLTFVTFEAPMNSPSDILRSGLTLLVQKNTAIEAAIRFSPLPSVQRLFKEATLAKNGMYPYDGTFPAWVLEEAGRGEAVLLNAKYLVDPAQFHVGDTLTAQCTQLFYTKGSRVREHFDLYIARLQVMGLLQKFLRDFSGFTFTSDGLDKSSEGGPSSDISGAANSSAWAIALEHFVPSFLLLVVGVLAAAVAFVYEKMLVRTERLDQNVQYVG